MTKVKYCFVVAMLLIFIFANMSLVESKTTKQENKQESKQDKKQENKQESKRVVILSDNDEKKAIESGCFKESKNKGKVKIYECEEKTIEKNGFIKDVNVKANDASVNDLFGIYKIQEKNKVKNYTGKGVRVVVIDSGIDYNHNELKSSYKGGYDFFNFDSDPYDDYGHGTEVSGIIVSDGIYNPLSRGVAPDAEIIALKVLNQNGQGYLGDIVNAIYAAVDQYNADVISISLGTSKPYTYYDYCDDTFSWVKEAIDYAKSKNAVVVVSAGNYGTDGLSAPGCLSSAISVGSINFNKEISYFSSVGKGVDVVAPGENILTTYVSNNYMGVYGTSYSAPAMAGFIALMKQRNKNANQDNIESALYKKAQDLGAPGKDDYFGNGIVNSEAMKFI